MIRKFELPAKKDGCRMCGFCKHFCDDTDCCKKMKSKVGFLFDACKDYEDEFKEEK